MATALIDDGPNAYGPDRERLDGILRPYSTAGVERLRGSVAGQMYPDRSLYPVDGVPNLVRRINAALARADQIEHAEGAAPRDGLVPLVAAAEAGSGGPLNAFELMKSMIEAGAAGVHFEDQLASEKNPGARVCGRGPRQHRHAHQREVGTGYFDRVAEVISAGQSSTLALEDSTEAHQF